MVVRGRRSGHRTRLVLGLAIAVVLGTGGFVAWTLADSPWSGGPCVVGTWKSVGLPFEIDGPDLLAHGGDLTLVYRAGGSGSQKLTNVRVGTETRVNGAVTFDYAADDRKISYTAVAGTFYVDVPDSHVSDPVSSLGDDLYTCRGDILTIYPEDPVQLNVPYPEVLRRVHARTPGSGGGVPR